MKAKEIRELSLEETMQKLRNFREQLLQLRMRKQTGQVEDPTRIRILRRSIARIETILNEKRKASLNA